MATRDTGLTLAEKQKPSERLSSLGDSLRDSHRDSLGDSLGGNLEEETTDRTRSGNGQEALSVPPADASADAPADAPGTFRPLSPASLLSRQTTEHNLVTSPDDELDWLLDASEHSRLERPLPPPVSTPSPRPLPMALPPSLLKPLSARSKTPPIIPGVTVPYGAPRVAPPCRITRGASFLRGHAKKSHIKPPSATRPLKVLSATAPLGSATASARPESDLSASDLSASERSPSELSASARSESELSPSDLSASELSTSELSAPTDSLRIRQSAFAADQSLFLDSPAADRAAAATAAWLATASPVPIPRTPLHPQEGGPCPRGGSPRAEEEHKIPSDGALPTDRALPTDGALSPTCTKCLAFESPRQEYSGESLTSLELRENRTKRLGGSEEVEKRRNAR